MSEENYKKEAVILLFEHLPPLAKALNNLSQLINEKHINRSELSFENIHEEDPEFILEIQRNVKAAVESLNSLLAKVSLKVNELHEIKAGAIESKREEVLFYARFQRDVLTPNILALSIMFQWLAGKEDEGFEFEEMINLFFEGSRDLGEIVETLTEEIVDFD